MAWIDRSRERDPQWEQYHVSQPHVGEGRRNPWLAAIQALAPAIRQYVEHKRADEVANRVLNMEQPPRAESVDPSLQGDPATRPQTGGANELQAQQIYQRYQDHEQQRAEHAQDRQPDTAMDDLKYEHLYRQVHPEEFPQSRRGTNGKYPVTMPDGSVIYVTGNAAAKMGLQNGGGQRSKELGVTLDELNTPDYVRYQDINGAQLSPEKAEADPDKAYAIAPGKHQMPYKQWKVASGLFRKAQGEPAKLYQEAVGLSQSAPSSSPAGLNRNPGEARALTPEDYNLVPPAAKPDNNLKAAPGASKENPVSVTDEKQAEALPPGTFFRTPKGQIRRR